MDILILGGYGAMAQSTVPDLLSAREVNRVGIAGRSLVKAEGVAKAQHDDRAAPIAVDARDSAALVRELRNWDCVINSTWYDLNVPIMEAAISAGYLSRLVTARIASPFPTHVDAAAYARAPRANFIDDLVLTKLTELSIEPSPLSSDSEFIRRAYRRPTGEAEVKRFLPQMNPNGIILMHDASSHHKVVRDAARSMENEGLLSVVFLPTPRGLVVAQPRGGRS